MADVIFGPEGITKVHDTGEVKVYALDGVDLELYKGELTVCSVLREAENRPC